MNQKLPPFTILNIAVSDMLEDLGEDVVYFDVDIELNGKYYRTVIFMNDFVDYLMAYHVEQGRYFDKVRSSIKGFGPKETRVYNTAIDEGFDFEPLLYRFIEDIRPLEHLTPQDNAPLSAKAHQKLESIANDLTELAKEGKSLTLREVQFADELMDYLTESVTKIYPEIFNSAPEHITQLHEILMRGIIDISNNINDLAYAAIKDEDKNDEV